MISHVSDGSSWKLHVWSISDRSSWRITVGPRISSTIFKPTAYKGRKRISLSRVLSHLCACTHAHAHTHVHTHTRAHTHTHTQTSTMASLSWWHWLWPKPTISLISTSVAMVMDHISVHISHCHKNFQLTCSLLLATNLHAPPKQTSTCDLIAYPHPTSQKKLVPPILAHFHDGNISETNPEFPLPNWKKIWQLNSKDVMHRACLPHIRRSLPLTLSHMYIDI